MAATRRRCALRRRCANSALRRWQSVLLTRWSAWNDTVGVEGTPLAPMMNWAVTNRERMIPSCASSPFGSRARRATASSWSAGAQSTIWTLGGTRWSSAPDAVQLVEPREARRSTSIPRIASLSCDLRTSETLGDQRLADTPAPSTRITAVNSSVSREDPPTSSVCSRASTRQAWDATS